MLIQASTYLCLVLLIITAISCSNPDSETTGSSTENRQDHHSYSNPEQVKVRHAALDLDVLFAEKTLKGHVELTLDRNHSHPEAPLILDTRNLKIEKAESSRDGVRYADTSFELGKQDPVLGAPLTIRIPGDTTSVRIYYSTDPAASGLQWLEPRQTAGKKHPYLFTQSQAIHARSWIPLQDTPGVRITYSARIRTPKELLAVMSARNTPDPLIRGEYTFDMPQPIPSYLIALAVGDLVFQPMSTRTGIYAEPSVVEEAAKEFADTENMMRAAESMFGLYRWDRYDILVLPPSFPFGGMENPRLTFATPTILAGDKSLVSLIAHELAHSWSGNLVTNATWSDFWLNEGFTVYLEWRIQEKVYGPARAQMEALLEKRELLEEMKTLETRDEILHVNLEGRDPDDGFTRVPYVKGALFLKRLEEIFSRDRFDPFLRGYFQRFAFRSITTADFVQYLRENLLSQNPDLARAADIDAWIYEPGLPATAPQPQSDALEKVEGYAQLWSQGQIKTGAIPVKDWSTQEWLHFLRTLPERLSSQQMATLDRAFRLTRTGNSEILFQWLLMSVRNDYEPAYPKLKEFLTTVGRRKFLKPLYEELVKTPEGRKRAAAIYETARSGYHPIAVATVDDILSADQSQQN